MRGTPRGWFFEGDARTEIDRATAECARVHECDPRGEPTVIERVRTCGDVDGPEGRVLFVLDDDGWWANYAHLHGWQELTPMQMLELFREMKSDGPETPGTGTTGTS